MIKPVIWFTGLSGSGKSTLADAVAVELEKRGLPVFRLDGDVLREGLCSDLGFSPEDRAENIRRAGEVAQIVSGTGRVVLASLITPSEHMRSALREQIGEERFMLVHVNCPVEICEERDVKGLYKKARSGEIKDFTGVSAPYDTPEQADIAVHTHKQDLKTCLESVLEVILPTVTAKHETHPPAGT